MGDAFKCKNCGTVVETLQSCPSCGETAMRPIQSSDDVVSDIDGATEADESPGTAASGTDESVTDADDPSPTAATDSDPADTTDPDTASKRGDATGRESRSESGLLSWLKSLF